MNEKPGKREVFVSRTAASAKDGQAGTIQYYARPRRQYWLVETKAGMNQQIPDNNRLR